MNVLIIQSPYDSGCRDARMGRGPAQLIVGGLEGRLAAAGHDVRAIAVEDGCELSTEIASGFALARAVAVEVRGAIQRDAFPLVLSGNCLTACMGVIAGRRARDLGALWLDGHLDFDEPDTTVDGALDAMALSVATGHSWQRMAATVPGFRPLPTAAVIHAGTRARAAAVGRLRSAGTSVLTASAFNTRRGARLLAAALDRLRRRSRAIYVHLDLDVLDPEAVGPANGFTGPGGLSTEDIAQAAAMVRDRFAVVGLGVTCFDPQYDSTGAVTRSALRSIDAFLGSS